MVAAVESPRTVHRLGYIDALRGFAALVVCLSHLALAGPNDGATPRLIHVLGPLLPGRQMVSLFLMLSAFSLFYSEQSRRAAGARPTSVRRFALRRFWRVAPTFYIAFLATALLIQVPGLYRDPRPESSVVTLGGVLSHLAFVHNLSQDWAFQADNPLWSIAAEMQLYALFPLLLLLMARARSLGRWRFLAPLAALLVSHLIYRVQPGSVTELARWFVLGVLVAEMAGASRRLPPWVALVGAGTYVLALTAGPVTPLLAVAFTLIILSLHTAETTYGDRVPRWAHWVGLRSYSLYAWHWPVLLLVSTALQETSLTGDGRLLVRVVTGLGLALVLAAAAFRFIERPSMLRARSV